MGKIKHLDKIEALFEKSPVINFRSIERVTGKGKNSSYAKLLIRNLIKKGKIIQLKKGWYSKHHEIGLAVFCFKQAYLGLQSALSYHGLWEQETMPVILTSARVRIGVRNVAGKNVYVRRISKKYCFGFEYNEDGSFYLPYSTVEKTLIDMAVYRLKITKEVLIKTREIINKSKLKEYLKPYPNKIKKHVMQLLEE